MPVRVAIVHYHLRPGGVTRVIEQSVAALDRLGVRVTVLTGAHSSADALKYADMCREFGLLASRGSDFHGPAESRCDLGSLPDLPGDLTPVWERLQSRIH